MAAVVGLTGAIAWATLATTGDVSAATDEFCTLDANRDGVVSADEAHAAYRAGFAHLQSGRSGSVGGHALAVRQFRTADADGDGALSRAEVEQALPAMAAQFDRYDLDRDGRLSSFEIHHPFMAHPPGRQQYDGVIERYRQPDPDRVYSL